MKSSLESLLGENLGISFVLCQFLGDHVNVLQTVSQSLQYIVEFSKLSKETGEMSITSLEKVVQFSKLLSSYSQSPTAKGIHINSLSLQFSHIPQDFGLLAQHLLSANPSPKLIQLFRSLHSLNLNGCTNLTDESLQLLSNSQTISLTRLTSLSLYWVPSITDHGIKHLFSHQTQIKSLCLSGMNKLTDTSIETIAPNCPQLEHIDLTKISQLSDVGLQALANHCYKLRTLNLYACCGFRDSGIESIANSCKNLRFLDLAGAKITDRSGKALGRCVHLQTLNLRWCVGLTDVSLEAFSFLKELNQLILFGNQNFTDAGLTALSRGVKQSLKILDLNGCTGIKDISPQKIKQLFPLVEKLEILS